MTQRSAKHKKKSLCEKSMLLVSNIMKLSSLSFATTSFGMPTKMTAMKRFSVKAYTNEVGEKRDLLLVLESGRSSSQWSQETESGSKPRSYLMEPQKGNYSPLRVTQETKGIDDIAADFIRRTRDKIKKSDDYHVINSSATNKAVKEISIF